MEVGLLTYMGDITYLLPCATTVAEAVNQQEDHRVQKWVSAMLYQEGLEVLEVLGFSLKCMEQYNLSSGTACVHDQQQRRYGAAENRSLVVQVCLLSADHHEPGKGDPPPCQAGDQLTGSGSLSLRPSYRMSRIVARSIDSACQPEHHIVIWICSRFDMCCLCMFIRQQRQNSRSFPPSAQAPSTIP